LRDELHANRKAIEPAAEAASKGDQIPFDEHLDWNLDRSRNHVVDVCGIEYPKIETSKIQVSIQGWKDTKNTSTVAPKPQVWLKQC